MLLTGNILMTESIKKIAVNIFLVMNIFLWDEILWNDIHAGKLSFFNAFKLHRGSMPIYGKVRWVCDVQSQPLKNKDNSLSNLTMIKERAWFEQLDRRLSTDWSKLYL